jgi:hypothetical protein
MPHLLAYVVVTSGATMSVKDDGSFAEDIAPGKYKLKVFHGGKWVHQESVDAEDTRAVTVQLKLEPGKAIADSPAGGDKAGGDKAKEPSSGDEKVNGNGEKKSH